MNSRSKITKTSWAAIRLFAMDVDGILTDGTVIIHSGGAESKTFSILDGLGLVRCREAGLALAWISGRSSGSSAARAAELKIPHLIQGRIDKLTALKELATYLNLAPAQVCYMGDDDIDASALRWAGISVTVPTAMPAALAAARYTTRLPAGRGAVREICEHLLAARGLKFPAMSIKRAIFLGLLPLAFNLGHAAENSPSEPAKNFILPTFTSEGYYSMRLCGSEARMLTLHLIELDDMNLTVFSGDASNHVDSILLSPIARVSLDEDIARGPGAIRLIRDDLDLTGEQWTYNHAKKSISIAKAVRVVFHSELKDLLK